MLAHLGRIVGSRIDLPTTDHAGGKENTFANRKANESVEKNAPRGTFSGNRNVPFDLDKGQAGTSVLVMYVCGHK